MIINEKYLPLWTGNYRTAVISGGRGSAKSFSVQTFIRDLTYESGHKILLTRYTMTSAKSSIIPEFVSKLSLTPSPYNKTVTMESDFDSANNTYINKRSLSEIIFTGIKTSSGVQTAKLKSIEGITTWVMEEAEELVDDGNDTEASTFDKIDDSIRLKGATLRTILVWNPSDKHSFVYKRFFAGKGEDGEDLDIEFNGIIDDILYIHTTYEDNIDNLNESTIRKILHMKETNPARYKHIYRGHPTEDVQGALWKQSTMIDPYRIWKAPDFKRVVTAVDPSVSDDEGDECGIVTVGMDFQNPPHFYVLSDRSGQYTTAEWGKIVVGEYKNQQADKLIAEKNNGGDLVAMNIKNVEKNLPVTLIHAKKKKIARAEPVAGLYEEGRVHHIGRFPELEQEMTTYDGDGVSPNRYDACLTKHNLINVLGYGKISIDKINKKHYVLTRYGYEMVLAAKKTGINKNVYFVLYSNGCYTVGTANHPIYSNNEWVDLIKLKKGDKVCAEKSLNLMGKNTQDIQKVKNHHIEIIILIYDLLKSLCFILLYGNFITKRKFLKVIVYIILTIIRLTIQLIIYYALKKVTTISCIIKMLRQKEGVNKGHIAKIYESLQRNGMEAKKEKNGILNTEKKHGLGENLKSKVNVSYVKKNINLFLNHLFAQRLAIQNIPIKNILKKQIAQYAERNLRKIDTEINQRHAVVYVVDVIPIRKKMDVYNLEVDNNHEYFANGILVHNCVYGITELSQNILVPLRVRSLK